MTLERIVLAVMVLIGILLCIFGILGAIYLGLLLPFAILMVMGGIGLVVIAIILYFLLI